MNIIILVFNIRQNFQDKKKGMFFILKRMGLVQIAQCRCIM